MTKLVCIRAGAGPGFGVSMNYDAWPHDGASLAVIGEVISEQLDIVPAKIQVIRHSCHKILHIASLIALPRKLEHTRPYLARRLVD